MPAVPAAPTSSNDLKLVKLLHERSTPEDGIAERCETLMAIVGPLLDTIGAGPFRHYTLHDGAHARKLVHLSEFVLKSETLEQLNQLELAVIIMASYMHDLGMAIGVDERERLLNSREFEDELGSWPRLREDYERTRRAQALAEDHAKATFDLRLFQLQEVALASLLRRSHASPERYAEVFEKVKKASGRDDLFMVNGVSFESELIDICVSHNLDVGALLEADNAHSERFQRDQLIGGLTLNSQFAAALLRVTDIMDFDRERTPRVLFESLGIGESGLPGGAVSLAEWNKHMAVHSLRLDEDELVIFADSTHPAIERTIRDFSTIIEQEIRNTTAVLRQNREEIASAYCLDLPLTVRTQIRSAGYAYTDFAFRLDDASISKLLMGEGLYPDRAVAGRELVQNAIDACRAREIVVGDGYSPRIRVTSKVDVDARTWLVVEDNGTGMDAGVLESYFFNVGSSYYSSAEFERLSQSKPFAPISRFGIGVLSVFLIGDLLHVQTKNLSSPRADFVSRDLVIDSRFGLAFVTEGAECDQGTTIAVRLAERSPVLADRTLRHLARAIEQQICRPSVPVELDLPPSKLLLAPDTYMSFRDGAEQLLVDAGLEPFMIDLGQKSDKYSGRALVIFHVQDDDSRSLSIPNSPLNVGGYLDNYPGNRITVNGVTMSMKRSARMMKFGGKRLSGAIDVDVIGDNEVEYSVARDKLIKSGVGAIKADIRAIIRSAIKEEYGNRVELPKEQPINFGSLSTFRPIEDEILLEAVRDALPTTIWPVGVHRLIAEELGQRPSLVHRAITTLLDRGEVSMPLRRAAPPVGPVEMSLGEDAASS